MLNRKQVRTINITLTIFMIIGNCIFGYAEFIAFNGHDILKKSIVTFLLITWFVFELFVIDKILVTEKMMNELKCLQVEDEQNLIETLRLLLNENENEKMSVEELVTSLERFYSWNCDDKSEESISAQDIDEIHQDHNLGTR